MKQNLKTFIIITAIFAASAVLFFLLHILSCALIAWGETEDIGSKYRIHSSDGSDVLLAKKANGFYDNYSKDIIIQRYKYNDHFALLFGWDSPQAIIQQEKDSIYRNYEQTLELFQKENKPFFMIIDKRNDSIHFPLTLTEYLLLRRELGVPDDLQLKLRL